jgi:hypothetical protein
MTEKIIIYKDQEFYDFMNEQNLFYLYISGRRNTFGTGRQFDFNSTHPFPNDASEDLSKKGLEPACRLKFNTKGKTYEE